MRILWKQLPFRSPTKRDLQECGEDMKDIIPEYHYHRSVIPRHDRILAHIVLRLGQVSSRHIKSYLICLSIVGVRDSRRHLSSLSTGRFVHDRREKLHVLALARNSCLIETYLLLVSRSATGS